MKFKYLIVFFGLVSSLFSQQKIETNFNVAAHPKGNKADLEYVIAHQLIYPKVSLKKGTKTIIDVHFVVTEDGSITNIEFKENYVIEFETEVKRLLRYIIFEPALMGNKKVASQTMLSFNFNSALYRKYTKARGFVIHKETAKFDTSFVIYDRADSSPEYYKGGEQGFNEYILSNLEYPDIAIKQNVQGVVVLSFIVEPNGTISNLFIEKEFNHFCTNEAIRLIRDTKWIPGTKDGKLIRYKTTYPIVFNINNHVKDNSMGEQR